MNAFHSSFPWTLALLLLLMASGCESTVEVDVPEHDPQLVVNSFFASDSRWVVEVSRSTGAFEDADLDDPHFTIDNATVTVEAPGQPALRLSYTDTLTSEPLIGGRLPLPGAYTSMERHPAPGQLYTVRVDADGFEPVEATSRIPPSVPITVSSTVRRMDDQYVDPPAVQQRRTLTLALQDPPDEDNYYWVRVAQIGRTFSREVRFTTRDRSILNDAPTDLDDTGKATLSRAFFSDALFDGRRHEIELDVDEVVSPDDADSPYPYFVVEVGALSEDLYDYLVSLRTFDETVDNPFAEPVNVYSNVEDGYGIVAGRHIETFTVPSEIVEP
jgi:hypothetical protein